MQSQSFPAIQKGLQVTSKAVAWLRPPFQPQLLRRQRSAVIRNHAEARRRLAGSVVGALPDINFDSGFGRPTLLDTPVIDRDLGAITISQPKLSFRLTLACLDNFTSHIL